jgi:Fe-S-cluster containining protein
MVRQKKPDCRTCGLCCVAPAGQDRFCDVVSEDLTRLSPSFVRKHVRGTLGTSDTWELAMRFFFLNHRAVALATKEVTQRTGPRAGEKATVCVALRGSLCHRVSCSIYRNRPQVCREAVVPGDRVCRRLRKEAGLT